MKNKVCILYLLSLIFAFTPPSLSAEIGKFNKKQAIVLLNGDSVEVGKSYFVIDPSSLKRKAKIQIDKITGDKAKATILKGKVEQGYQLALGSSSDEDSSQDSTSGSSTSSLQSSWGIMGSYVMNSMSAKRTSGGATATTSMSGSTFGLSAFYNFAFSKNLSLKFSGAYDPLTVTGSIASPPGCTSGTNCDANITYLSGYGHANYYISTGSKYRPQVGIGLGFLFPMSKSSTALNTDKISMNQVINLALGLDIRMGKGEYLPIAFEYNYFSPSDTVSATMMILKAGWAWDL